MRHHPAKILSIWGTLLLVANTVALAQQYDLADIASAAPSTDDIIKALTPHPPLLNPSDNDQPPAAMTGPAFPLLIQYELDAYQLTDAALTSLDNLGSALVSNALAGYRFGVQSYSGASSSDANGELSEQRAASVRNYLITIFKIDEARLQSVDAGEGALIEADSPADAHRVVLIVNLGLVDS